MLKEFGYLYRDDIRSEAERRFGLKRSGSLPLDGSHSYVFEYPMDGSPVILKITHRIPLAHANPDGKRSQTQFLGPLRLQQVGVTKWEFNHSRPFTMYSDTIS